MAKQKGSTGWDFLIHISDILYNLISLKKFGGFLLFVFAIILLVFVFRYPENELPKLIDKLGFIGKFISGEKFYIFPLLTLFGVSLFGNFIQYSVYGKEIKRIAEERNKLVQGITDGSLKPLKQHRSSNLKNKGE